MDSLIEIPNEFIDILNNSKKSKNEIEMTESNSHSDRHFKLGERNQSLFKLAGSLWRAGLNQDQVFRQLLQINNDVCSPKLNVDEIKMISKSISKYPSVIPGKQKMLGPIKVWTFNDFMNDPSFKEPCPVVEGLFNLGEMHIVSAPAKAGKSILVTNLSLSIARGTKFLNKFLSLQLRVLYLQTEIANYQLRKRFEKIVNLEDYETFSEFLSVAVERIKIDRSDGIDRIKSIIEEGGFKVLILDPFYTLHTSSEDSSSDIAPILSNLREIALKLNILIVLVHHQGKKREDGGQTGHKTRGSSSFADVPDGNLSLRRVSTENAILEFEMRNIQSPNSMELILKDNLSWEYFGDVAEPQSLTTSNVEDFLNKNGEKSYEVLSVGLSTEYGVSLRTAQSKISEAERTKKIFKRKEGKFSFYRSSLATISASADEHMLRE
jgi:hypothetical protein